MRCDTCKADISEGEEIERFGKVICEDCYMDALSPTRMCNPWAAHSAKTFTDHHGAMAPTDRQKSILGFLKDHGIVDPDLLFDRLQRELAPSDCERELAALLRMELITIEKDGDRINIQLARPA